MTRHSVRGLGQLLTVVPFQLHFHPSESLVIVGMSGGAVACVARVDLPAPGELATWLRQVGAPAYEHLQDAILVAYDDRDPRHTAMSRLAAAYRTAGVLVHHQLVVEGSDWYAVRCACGMCPRVPTPIPPAHEVAVATQLLASGTVVFPDRAAYEADLAGPCPRQVELPEGSEEDTDVEDEADEVDADKREAQPRLPAVVTATPRQLEEHEDGLRTIVAVADPHGPPVLSLGPRLWEASWECLQIIGIRDLVLGHLCPQMWAEDPWPDPSGVLGSIAVSRVAPCCPAAEHVAATGYRLAQWAKPAPAQLAPAAWTVVAAYAWGTGAGAASTIAVERALAHDPGYSLAGLIEQLVIHGVKPPSQHESIA